jgi:hypothetical protein
MKALIFMLLFCSLIFGQQINYTFGKKTPGGSNWSGAGIVYIDTTTGTTNNIIVDLNDFYPFDQYPAIGDTSGNAVDGKFFYFGTLYCLFDNQGTASPTTDSLIYTVKVYPGVYTAANKPISGIKWGAAVTLETIRRVNDYLSVNNVYTHATAEGALPPEVVKLEIAPVGDVNCDDSTGVYWRFAYPAIYQQQKEKKSD